MVSTPSLPQPFPIETIQTPQDYAALLHPVGSRGAVTVGHKPEPPDSGKQWEQRTVTIGRLSEAMSRLAGQPDYYLTPNRFKGPRSIGNLLQLRAVWADLDYYKSTDLRGPVLGLIGDRLQEARCPAPSLIIDSGRGMYVIWLLRPVAAGALPRWTAVQRRLLETLKDLGSDAGARDAARVLRLVGTRNSRGGRLARVIGGDGREWEFDGLCDEILPLTRAALHDLQVQRALRQRDRKPSPRRHKSLQSLWSARLTDIQSLIELRFPGGQLPPGHRDVYLFMVSVCMAYMVNESKTFDQEIRRFAQRHCPWTESQIVNAASAVRKRAESYQRGETVTWGGRQIGPQYRMRTSTMIEWLQITEQEQRQMKTLIGPEEKQRRRYKATRRDWLAAHTQERRKPWEQVGMNRSDWYALGKPLP